MMNQNVNVLDEDQFERCDTCGAILDKSRGEDFYVEALGVVLCARHWKLYEDRDFSVNLDLTLQIELVARDHGYTLTTGQVTQINENVNGTLNELNYIKELVQEAVKDAVVTQQLLPDLQPEALKSGATYRMKSVPALKKEFHGKLVVFKELNANGNPVVVTEKGVALQLDVCGAGGLELVH